MASKPATDNALVPVEPIQGMIFTLRGVQVMLDADLAKIYGVETKVFNQAVKRNMDQFSELFWFQRIDAEKYERVTNCDRSGI